MAKKKHLTDLDRLEIEHGLRHSLSLKKIAAKVGKHHSTIAREILARSVASDKGAYGRVAQQRRRFGDKLLCLRRAARLRAPSAQFRRACMRTGRFPR
jgi:IS30 family transposase